MRAALRGCIAGRSARCVSAAPPAAMGAASIGSSTTRCHHRAVALQRLGSGCKQVMARSLYAAAAQPPSAPHLTNPPTSTRVTSVSPPACGVSLEDLVWDHSFVRELPGDPDPSNQLRQVFSSLYSRVSPTPAAGEPHLIAYSAKVACLLGLDPSECERPEFPLIASGAAPLPGALPYAQCYGGHQFGQWAGQLGDGRAITLGEVLAPAPQAPDTPHSGRPQRWELQLKGAGKTPYSRRADGRAVLRSSLREYVASEAMAALGVPTTRALSLVATGEPVLRDMFYNGNARYEPGAVVCRVAPSFVRFGTFQLPAMRGGGQLPLVQSLADYVIRHHFPHLLHQDKHKLVEAGAGQQAHPPSSSSSSSSSREGGPVIGSSEGGVGAGGRGEGEAGSQALPPEVYSAFFTEVCCSSARMVAMWQSVGFVHGVLNTDNMSILGLTIDYGPFGFLDRCDPYWTPNLTDAGGRRYAFRGQPEVVHFNLTMLGNALMAGGMLGTQQIQEALDEYAEVMSREYNARMAQRLGLKAPDRQLSAALIQLMYDDGADFTLAFRALCSVDSAEDQGAALPDALLAALPTGGLEPLRHQAWTQWLDLYRARLRAEGQEDGVRQAGQRAVCPKFIPRQHLLHGAIEAAEVGDYSELQQLMHVLTRPYDEQPEADAKYSAPPPPDLVRPGVCQLSCSS
ncbi:hypothetical protein V8C86DRAFT_1755079 [Haematococcus lacustris]